MINDPKKKKKRKKKKKKLKALNTRKVQQKKKQKKNAINNNLLLYSYKLKQTSPRLPFNWPLFRCVVDRLRFGSSVTSCCSILCVCGWQAEVRFSFNWPLFRCMVDRLRFVSPLTWPFFRCVVDRLRFGSSVTSCCSIFLCVWLTGWGSILLWLAVVPWYGWQAEVRFPFNMAVVPLCGWQAQVRVWRSDLLQTLHVLGTGIFTKAVMCLAFMPNKVHVMARLSGTLYHFILELLQW